MSLVGPSEGNSVSRRNIRHANGGAFKYAALISRCILDGFLCTFFPPMSFYCGIETWHFRRVSPNYALSSDLASAENLDHGALKVGATCVPSVHSLPPSKYARLGMVVLRNSISGALRDLLLLLRLRRIVSVDGSSPA